MNDQALLFDTTTLIDFYRGQVVLEPYFEALLEARLNGYISVITEAELWRGLRTDEIVRHEAMGSLFTKLPLNSAAARQAGAWMQKYTSRGLGWMDALIVATAQQINVPVVTRDLRLAQCLQDEATFQIYLLGTDG